MRLGDISSFISKGTTPKNFTETGIRYIKIESLDGTFVNPDRCLYIKKETHLGELKRSILRENDILFAIAGATIGKVGIVNKNILPANTNQALAIIRLSNKGVIDFIVFILSSRVMKKYIRESISVGAQPNLNLQQINDFRFFSPQYFEQIKIANFLSLIGNRIETQNKIIDRLESLMLGFRQKIFSQELRFKDDKNEFSNWNEKRLKDICIKESSNISANSLQEITGGYKVYGATGYLQNIDFYQEEKPYVSIVKDGAGVGRTMLCEGQSSVLGTLDRIKPKNDNSLYFLYFLLKTVQFDKYKTGSTIPHIYFKDYSKEKIKIPCSSEQKNIANFLSSIDKKLEKEKLILKQYQEQKKHLLQNIFI
ncbi:restriction endonuclease subunit S [Mesonia sp. K4-1]|nr:restriction endonuclease subunit S [Mesonia sp. K4-1]